MIRLCGEGMIVEPLDGLTAAERDVLDQLGTIGGRPSVGNSNGRRSPFRLRLVEDDRNPRSSMTNGVPAQIEWRDGKIRLFHSTFTAEIDPIAGVGRLSRPPDQPHALEMALRTAMCCRLPFNGKIPLHAAGVCLPAGGVAFFGPSGAGKSTIAASSVFPVYSDELVVIGSQPPTLEASGFWGTFESADGAVGSVPLLALVELDRGPVFKLSPVDRTEAWPRLLNEIRVPNAPALWRPTIGVLASLIDSVPVFRMSWSPSVPPWDELQVALGPTAGLGRQVDRSASMETASSAGCSGGSR